jgi:pyruvate/2-oxoacid:ferredoxin oxidoreductase beta subunit
MRGDRETTVVAWAGDGGTFDIGLQALSGAAERNEDIIYACYDNEAYMNTGIQRSGATPYGAWTTTTPYPHVKQRPKKRMLEIMAAHRIPYVATASVAYPDDLVEKFRKAKEFRGTKFIHIFAPCPTGWKSPPEYSVELARLAVRTRLFPLLEIFGGVEYRVFKDFEPAPVKSYLELQGRFSHLTEEEVARIQREVDQDWEILLAREGTSAGLPGVERP